MYYRFEIILSIMCIQSKYNFLPENMYIIHRNEPNVINKSFTLLRTL